jgi:hypothetical protein
VVNPLACLARELALGPDPRNISSAGFNNSSASHCYREQKLILYYSILYAVVFNSLWRSHGSRRPVHALLRCTRRQTSCCQCRRLNPQGWAATILLSGVPAGGHTCVGPCSQECSNQKRLGYEPMYVMIGIYGSRGSGQESVFYRSLT